MGRCRRFARRVRFSSVGRVALFMGQAHKNCGAGADAAFDSDIPAVQLGQALDDRQPEPEAVMLARQMG